MQRMFYSELKRSDSVDSFIDRIFDNVDIRDTIMAYNPIDNKKGSFFSNARKEYETNNSSKVFDGFQATVDDMEAFFFR